MGKKRRARRTKAEVEEIWNAAYVELAEGNPMTLRQVHYRLVSRGDTTYTNTRVDYNQLSKWLVNLRLAGVIPWEWIEDRLRGPRTIPMWEDLTDFVAEVRRSYRRDVWSNQLKYVEVVVEKDALSGIFESGLRPYGVTLNVARGYDSWSSLKDASERYQEAEALQEDGVTVLYFGDFDPSGEDMVRSLEERLGELGCFPEIVKCALTFEDIERYELPPDFTKTTDSRRDAFVEQYGDIAVELDALPADVLRQRIRTEVEDRMDLEALERNKQLELEERRRLDQLLS